VILVCNCHTAAKFQGRGRFFVAPLVELTETFPCLLFLVLLAVSIVDKASVIFGGSDAPAALGTVYSIGGISMESNGAITNDVTDALSPFGLAADRMYINFFDVPRSNMGWNRKTFAG
jgi:Macrophage migration inhibitory factor (MIF)